MNSQGAQGGSGDRDQFDPEEGAPCPIEQERARRKRRTFHNEVANTITHGAGFAMSVGGLVVLLYLAISRGGAMHIVSFAVYGACLVLSYLASTVYHATRCRRRKLRRRMWDHIAIYLLIAGSYTPFMLIGLDGGGWGWSLFGVAWGIAIAGIAMKILVTHRPNRFSTTSYLMMGWLAIIAIKPLYDSLATGAFVFLILGGAAYTIGVYFFARDHKYMHHAVWHLFVMAGSILHFLAIAIYLTPAKGA